MKPLAVARASDGELVATDASFVVPRGAGLDIWFEATNRYGCHATDATADAPYHFTIE